MHRFTFPALATIVCVAPIVAQSNDPARALIDRAIQAQGGDAQVAKLTKAWRAKVRGGRDKVKIVGEWAFQSPGQMKIDTTTDVEGKKNRTIVVLNGDKGWHKSNDKSREVKGEELRELQESAYHSRRIRFLLPLIQEPGFTLSLVGDKNVAQRPAAGVRVQSPGRRDFELYFDKETGLLVKLEYRVERGRRVMLMEQVFSDYKDFAGVQFASKSTKYDNGIPGNVEEITDLTFVDKIDAKEFDQP